MSVYTHGKKYVTKKSKFIGWAWSEKSKFIGWAWSHKPCMAARTKVKHKPHIHDSEFYAYGPYCCSGFPEKKVRVQCGECGV